MSNRRLKLPLFLTAEQTASVLNVPISTVYEKIRQGKLPISPHGKPYRVDRDGLFRMARSMNAGGEA
ncbi:MAG: helix-turn-helix domain-containing protein [Firmicutes bacterium]|nr:helix-turn-helix domain-containing protein [Bacillota bacterium]